jgi:hypothetical protein
MKNPSIPRNTDTSRFSSRFPVTSTWIAATFSGVAWPQKLSDR